MPLRGEGWWDAGPAGGDVSQLHSLFLGCTFGLGSLDLTQVAPLSLSSLKALLCPSRNIFPAGSQDLVTNYEIKANCHPFAPKLKLLQPETLETSHLETH